MKINRTNFKSYYVSETEELPLFFYHVPKTGGTTFVGLLTALAQSIGQAYTFIPGKVGKFLVPLPPNLKKSEGTIMGGHCKYPFHKVFNRPISLVTILREPVSRCVSEYLWLRRLVPGEISRIDFEYYLENLHVPNYCTRLFSGEDLIGFGSFEIAKRNLLSFKFVGTTDRLMDLGTILLSRYGAGSICVENAKVEGHEIKAELQTTHREAIERRNELDKHLYDFFSERFSKICSNINKDLPERSMEILVQNVAGKTYKLTRLS